MILGSEKEIRDAEGGSSFLRILVDGTYLTTKHLRGIGRYTQTLCRVIAEFRIGILYILVGTVRLRCLRNLRTNLAGIDHRLVLVPLPGRLLNFLVRYGDFYSIIRKVFRIDVIHIPYEKYYRTKSINVMTVHGMEPFFHQKEGKFFKNFRKNLLSSTEYVSRYMAVSGSVKSDLLRFLPLKEDRVDEIPIALDKAFLSPRKHFQRDRPLHILYYGGFEQNKNLKNLIKGLDEVERVDPNLLRLRVVGDPKWHAEQIGISLERSYVEGLGYLDREALIAEILHASCVIVPSIYEGYGLPLVEALCLQTPVLTSRNVGALEYVKQGYIPFDPHSYQDICNAILTFHEKRAQIDAQANMESEKVKARLSLEGMAHNLKRVYGQIS